MTGITLVTHAAAPDGVEDDHLLAQALRARDADVRMAVWNDPAVDWAANAVTVIRSTWDYHLHQGAWFAWLSDVSCRTRLVNPVGLVRWNSDKAYLLQLAERGVAVVPSVLLDGSTQITTACSERNWHDVVVKPTLGASAFGARRFRGAAAIGTDGVAHAAALTAQGRALLQPYQPAVETERERSLVYIDGALSHAFSKPAFHSGLGEGSLKGHTVTAAEDSLATRVIAALPSRPVFARIDMIPSQAGPLVMEAELIEPQLALGQEVAAAARLAHGLLRIAEEWFPRRIH